MRKIALVGTAPSSVHAPFNDPSWEIWGLCARGSHVTRASRWFEVHRISAEFSGDDLTEWRDLVNEWSGDCELWMFYPGDLADENREIIHFPVDRIAQRFGTYFMTSTFAWMFALAIDELRPKDGPSVDGQVGIWGADMEYDTEYREQRAGLRHFMELAKFLGIAVTVLVNGGAIYDPTPYPFWQDDPLVNKTILRHQRLTAEKLTREGILKAGTERMGKISAVKDELASVLDVKSKAGFIRERLKKLEKERSCIETSLPKMQLDVAWAQGALDEIDHLRDYIKP